ncbi:MAG: hypothetical protein E6R08_02865 [Nevskiaceae bacterium]|nr:MAG: hypothetical protein E6R08_02865 [Nevskiaceae bacterium]
MIDTIHIRLHDLKANYRVAEQAYHHWKGMTAGFYEVDPTKAERYLKLKYVEFNDSRKTTLRYINRFIAGSYHYTVNYRIDVERDFIEYQLSIPKYLYGSNVLQFVQHRDELSKMFDATRATKWKWNANQLHDRLIAFVRKFFKDQYPNLKVNMRYVELNRIDLCWNQFFDSAKDAFVYMDYQKRIRKRYLRGISNNMDRYDTTIFYKNEYYSFKIYHKGTEFKKHDAVEMRRLNKLRKRLVFDVNKYQAVADRILRYEMTIRSQWMSRLYRQQLFRKDCPTWKKRMRIHAKYHALHNKAQRTAKRKGEGKAVDGAYDWRDWLKEPKEMRQIYDQTNAMLGQTATFYFETSMEVDRYNRSGLDMAVKVSSGKATLDKPAKFSKGLLYLITQRFRTECLHFQVKETVYFDKLDKQLIQYNEDCKKFNQAIGTNERKGVKAQKLMQFVVILQKYSRDEAIRMGLVSRAAWYRNMKLLANFGITGNVYATHTIPTEMGFERYHFELMNNGALKTANPFFH